RASSVDRQGAIGSVKSDVATGSSAAGPIGIHLNPACVVNCDPTKSGVRDGHGTAITAARSGICKESAARAFSGRWIYSERDLRTRIQGYRSAVANALAVCKQVDGGTISQTSYKQIAHQTTGTARKCVMPAILSKSHDGPRVNEQVASAFHVDRAPVTAVFTAVGGDGNGTSLGDSTYY